jgi:hypothetical protein
LLIPPAVQKHFEYDAAANLLDGLQGVQKLRELKPMTALV